ncbi:hypothetical protein WJX72_011924 [[Myrmecia] bisecta]|uniref:HNH nuclease domain-containing protein n=1 Tax=[Myrmecia] bisecta TaxID=41462 RepID=A0AAW1QGQ2_9CHLO
MSLFSPYWLGFVGLSQHQAMEALRQLLKDRLPDREFARFETADYENLLLKRFKDEDALKEATEHMLRGPPGDSLPALLIQPLLQAFHPEALLQTVSQDLQEIKNMLRVQAERQQTQAYVSAMLLARDSPFSMHKPASSAASNPRLKERLVKLYQLETHRDDKNRQYVRCQVSRETMLSGALVAGHLFPRREADRAIDWGILEPDDDERNGLVWYPGIEQVFSNDQVCLEFDPHDNTLRFRVLDKDLLGKSPVAFAAEKHRIHATERLKSMTFDELDNKPLYFPDDVDVRPYERVIVSQAAHAIANTWKRGKLRHDIDHFVLDVVSDFAQKPVLAWVRTTMACLPDWPVGPGAEMAE